MENNLKVLSYKDFNITYDETTNTVLKIIKGDFDLSQELTSSWYNIKYTSYYSHIYDNSEWREHSIAIMGIMFNLSSELYKDKKEAFAYMVCSNVFACLTPYSNYLRMMQRYFNMLTFWDSVLLMVQLWEKGKDFKVHIASVYGYKGEIYAYMRNSEKALYFIHKAVKADNEIKNFIENYHKTSPGYRIVTLNRDTNHFMEDYVKGVRDFLDKEIEMFARNFRQYKDFELSDFDEIFLDNSFFNNEDFYEDIKINVCYFIWEICHSYDDIDYNEKTTTFENLNKLHKLTGLCLIIESMLKELNPSVDSMNKRFKKLYKYIGGQNDFNDAYQYMYDINDPQKVGSLLKSLLDATKSTFNGKTINDIDRCILTFSLIRNFTAHNLKSVEAIGNRYHIISRLILFLFFMFLINLNKKNYNMN